MKRIKIGDKYYIQDEQGILHQEEDVNKEIYNYLTSSYKEKVKNINPNKPIKTKCHRNIFKEIDTKNTSKSNIVTKILVNDNTYSLLESNKRIKKELSNEYGLFGASIIINNDVYDGYLKLYYDDNRVETVEISGSYVKKQHYAETLIDEIKKNKYRK